MVIVFGIIAIMELYGFNIHKIRLELILFKTKHEKLEFLNETKTDLERIIQSFESEKIVSLRYYARDDMNIEGNSIELRDFLRNVILKYTHNIKDCRYPNEDILNRAVVDELKRYEHLLQLVDMEIEYIEKENDALNDELKSA